jgi:hypothetical protein
MWVRLEYRGKVTGEGLHFISIGGRGGRTVETSLDVSIFVFMKELFNLVRSPVE